MSSASSSTSIRRPAVAGRFYPAAPGELRQTLARLWSGAAEVAAPDAPLRAVIAPHAGYAYSGPVAASAFQALRGMERPPRRVVLLGPAHYVAFSGLSVPGVGSFATPLGDVAVDRAAVETLLNLPEVYALDEPHEPEHALEVELPFLIDALGGADRFTIVPLLFSDASTEVAIAALEAVCEADTLTVVSSDLSHYLDHAAATAADRATADAILENHPQRVGPSQACGHVAVRALMRLAATRRWRGQCPDLRNSGDTQPGAAGRDRVVGYGAFVFTG